MDVFNKLSFLFGNEETVQRRRQLVFLREGIRNTQHNVHRGLAHVSNEVCSGSLGEGVAYPPSDDDVMIVLGEQSNRVYDIYTEAVVHRAKYMISSEYSPGFCILQNLTTTGLSFLSSKEFRETFVRKFPGYHAHGPCASVEYGIYEYDIAPCLLCPHWPTLAIEWITRRRRYGWPPQDLVEEIVRGGCHVVPIGNPDSPLCDLEWRVSFSLAERSLIHAFNHPQFLVYNLLKLILKRIIAVRVENALCSYFLKTVLYYTIENTSPEIWRTNTIDECYRECLSLLYHFIDTRNCPNYFVPNNNMMRRKVNESNKLPLLRIIGELMRCGIAGFCFCGEGVPATSTLLSHAHIELRSDKCLLSGYHISVLMSDVDMVIRHKYEKDIRPTAASNVLSPLLSSYKHIPTNNDSSFLNVIFKKILAIMGSHYIEISTIVKGRNSFRYQMFKYGQAMLKLGSNTDVCSGKLLLANFMYMTGRFRHCLAIVHAVLSKFAPYVIRCCQKDDEPYQMYIDVICNTAHSLDYRASKAFAHHVTFYSKRTRYVPFPLKIVDTLKKYVTLMATFDPLVFAYYLQGLCFYKLHDFDSMNVSGKLLEDSIRNLPMEHSRGIFFGRLLLGYMKMLQQDYRFACRCFASAYLMKDLREKISKLKQIEESHTCLILISCLLNRNVQTR